jgi:hypothetical protein
MAPAGFLEKLILAVAVHPVYHGSVCPERRVSAEIGQFLPKVMRGWSEPCSGLAFPSTRGVD